MTANGITSGDPRKLDKSGGTMTGELVLVGGSPAASEAYVAAHAGGSGPSTLTFSATLNTDVSVATHFRCTLTNDFTLANPTNPTDGRKVIWEFIQDANGSRHITLGSAFALGTDVASVVLSTGANKRDLVGAVYDATVSKWLVIALARGY